MNFKEIGYIDGDGELVSIGQGGLRDDHSICPNWETDKEYDTRYDKIKAYCLETKSIRVCIDDNSLNVEFFFKPTNQQIIALLIMCENVDVVYVDVDNKLDFKKIRSIYGGECYTMTVKEFSRWVKNEKI